MSSLFRPVDWIKNSNLYEVNVRQYTREGTFEAFGSALPRLKDMGVEVLWFMPITPISIKGRQGSLGSYYACSDYTATNPEFGSVDDFRNLVAKCHKLGFKVIIDWVANHTGLDHWWTEKHPGYYSRDAQGNFYDKHGWHDVIDLNYYNQYMRRDMIEAMKFWINKADIDGFRCDMAHLVPLDFWREAREELDELKPLFWLAETEVPSYHQAFDASYTWNWMHQSEKFSRGTIGFNDLINVLFEYKRTFPKDALRLFFTANHDENSWNGTEYEKYGDAARVFAVLSCTWDGLPLIYSGQELPNLKRLKFFDKDEIEWQGDCKLHTFYKSMLELRKTNPALNAADDAVETHRISTSGEHVFCFLKKNGNREVLVVLNFSSHVVNNFEFRDPQIAGTYRNIFNNLLIDMDNRKPLMLQPWDYQVLER